MLESLSFTFGYQKIVTKAPIELKLENNTLDLIHNQFNPFIHDVENSRKNLVNG